MTLAEMSSSVLWYSFALNIVEFNELFSNIYRYSLVNVGLGSYDGSKYLNYSNFYKKVQSIIE
jgi:hypothetical protein